MSAACRWLPRSAPTGCWGIDAAIAGRSSSRERMPILFSGADVHTGLIYWATIDDITIDHESRKTTCSYSSLRPITPPKPLSALRLRSGDRLVSDDLIRPYATHHPQIVVLNAGATPVIGPLHEQTWETFSTNWDCDVRQVFNSPEPAC